MSKRERERINKERKELFAPLYLDYAMHYIESAIKYSQYYLEHDKDTRVQKALKLLFKVQETVTND